MVRRSWRPLLLSATAQLRLKPGKIQNDETFRKNPKYPDFTIEDDDAGVTYYWEHCGMLRDPAYRRRWNEKQVWYRAHGILPKSEGGGPKGTLIVSEDQPDGGINSAALAKLVAIITGS